LNTEIKTIEGFYTRFYQIIMFICKILLVADIGITSVAVLGRYVPFMPDPAWSEEIVLTCMIYMALLSAALAVKRQAHIRMTALDRYLPEKLVRILDLFGDLVLSGSGKKACIPAFLGFLSSGYMFRLPLQDLL